MSQDKVMQTKQTKDTMVQARPAQANTSTDSFNEIKSTDAKLSGLGAQKAKSGAEFINSQGAESLYRIFEPEELVQSLNIRPLFKIVEFGCGIGKITLELARQAGPEAKIYGVDVQKDLLINMLREAKQNKLNNLYAVWGDLDKLGGSKLPDAQFDMVLIVNTLFQLENKDIALKEAFRILKPGSSLVIVDWLDSDLPIGPRKEQLIKKEELLEYALDAGFIFSEESKLGEHHFKLEFNKKLT